MQLECLLLHLHLLLLEAYPCLQHLVSLSLYARPAGDAVKGKKHNVKHQGRHAAQPQLQFYLSFAHALVFQCFFCFCYLPSLTGVWFKSSTLSTQQLSKV